VQARNPSLVLVDPEIITHSPGIYLRAGILDSLAKWYEGRSVWPSVQNPDVQTAAAFQLAEVLYKGHRKYAIDAVRLNAEHRVEDGLIQTLDIVILLTGMIQSLAKGTLFNAIAHPLHNGLTLMKESHYVLHGLKVGYAIMVQLCVEKCPRKEFEDVLSFFRQLGLEPSLKGLNLPFDRELILRVADKAAHDPDIGPLNYPVNKQVIASAMEKLEKRLA
jgi:glycerol dehydrogenase